MLRLCSSCIARLQRQRHIQSACTRYHSNHTINRPRILFFGSDTFSIGSLEKLRQAKKDEDLYESLEIITKEPAPSGRGLEIRKGIVHERLVDFRGRSTVC